MFGNRIAVFAVVVLALGARAFAADISPEALLEKVAAAYAEMQTYQGEGVVVSEIDTGAVQAKIKTSFTIALKKPNLYRITWSQKHAGMPSMAMGGAVWSDGTQPHLYMGLAKAYTKLNNDMMALASATGFSGGAAMTVPSLIFDMAGLEPFMSRLTEPKIDRVEAVEGEDCYVLTSPTPISVEETFWISTKTHLLKKHHRSLEIPETEDVIPQMTDAELEEAIRAMGQDVTEERKKQMREMLERSEATLTAAELKGYSVETHTHVASPELGQDAFVFAVPEGTTFNATLLGSLMEATTEAADETHTHGDPHHHDHDHEHEHHAE